jgi:hypothetical protein
VSGWWCTAADSFVAFILYRQHHQQAIIARNPGLNNPDISKIIGEQWKAEGEESKKVWQDLAQVSVVEHSSLTLPDFVRRKKSLDIKSNTQTTVTNPAELVNPHRSTPQFNIRLSTSTAARGVVDVALRHLPVHTQTQLEPPPYHLQTTRKAQHLQRATCR